MGHVAATFTQAGYRWRNDDGNESGASYAAALNTPVILETSTVARCRIHLDETAGGAENNVSTQWQYQLNGNGWNNITTTSSVVQAATSTQGSLDATATTQQISSGTFVSAEVTEDGLSDAVRPSFSGNEDTELELVFQIVDVDVADTDTVELRVVRADGTLFDTYSQTPSLTVEKTASAVTVQAAPASLSATAQAADPQVASSGDSISENWVCADSASIDCQLAWTTVNGDFDLVSNHAVSQTNSARNIAVADTQLASEDMRVEVLVTPHQGTNPNAGCGPIARASNSAQTHYYAQLHLEDQVIRITRTVGGTNTNLAADESFTVNADQEYKVSLSVADEGADVRVIVEVDDVEIFNLLDTSPITGFTRAGIRDFRFGDGDSSFNTFEAGPDVDTVAVQASPASLATAAQTVSPQQAALTVSAVPATLTSLPQTVTPTVAPVVIQVAPASLATVAQTTNPTQAALSVQAVPASLTAAAQTVNPAVSGAAVTVQAVPAALSATGQPASPQQAAQAVSAAPATSTASASVVDPQVVSEGVTVQAAPATLATAAQTVTPTTAALTVQADPASITATGQVTQPTAAGFPVTITAAPATMTTNAQTTDVVRAGLVVQADPATVSTAAQALVPAFDAKVLQAVAATINPTASAVLGIEGEKRRRLEGSGVLMGSTEGSKTGSGFLEGSKV